MVGQVGDGVARFPSEAEYLLPQTMYFLVCLLICGVNGWYYGRPDPGATINGGVWPLPWTSSEDTTYNHTISSTSFQFTSNLQGCDIIDKALSRYAKITFAGFDPAIYTNFNPSLRTLNVKITQSCTNAYPQMEMDESYQIDIKKGIQVATITANEIWGALRGLETFSQLIFASDSKLYIRPSSVADSPRFPHRGVMLDSARHFLPVSVLLQNLDVMAMNKMNVFHWHLVDSESFPYPSLKYPNLTKFGAYDKTHQYTISDITAVLDFARLRGIRIIPEFDTPGHTGSWGYGIPNLLSTCYNSQGQIDEMSNIIDATWPPNYTFLSGFFTEALELFKDNYMHFGGDEVYYDMMRCWYNNNAVRQRMQEQGFGSDTSALLNHYWQQMFEIIDKARTGTKKMVWQEVLDLSVEATGAIAHVWKGSNIQEAMQEMATVTAAGHNAVLSSCWYLNYIKYGADWGFVNNTNMQERGMYYECDPQNFAGTPQQKALVLGGEAALWGEFVDGTNLVQRLWPRASAVAERLWSDPLQTTSATAAWPRLHEMRCRLIRRGIPVQPIMDPDFCPQEWNPSYTPY